MKLLLATIRTDNAYSEYALRSMFSVVSGSPVETEMKVYDCTDTDLSIYENIMEGQYNIIYLHCDEYNVSRIAYVSEMIKKAAPSNAVIAGGEEITVDTADFMRSNPWIDYVLRGEGEIVLYNFIRSIFSYEFEFETIGGLSYRSGENIIVNEIDEPAEMDDLPFVYEATEIEGDTVWYETIRGTSDHSSCTRRLYGDSIRPLSLGRVCRELRYFMFKEVRKVVIFDKFFNYNSERAFRLFEYLISNDNGITSFELNICGENLDDETVRLLNDARKGLFIFNIDVASTNPEILSAICKRENIYQLMYNVTKLLQTGRVECRFFITAGLPNETPELFSQTFNRVYALAEGSPVSTCYMRLPAGSDIRKQADKYGYEFTFHPPYEAVLSDAMPARELIRIRNIMNISELYLGKGGFFRSVDRMLSDTGLRPFEVFSRLYDYIRSSGMPVPKADTGTDVLARALYSFAVDLYDDTADTLKLDDLRDIVHSNAVEVLGRDYVILEDIPEAPETAEEDPAPDEEIEE